MRRLFTRGAAAGAATIALGVACASGPYDSIRSKYETDPVAIDPTVLHDALVVPPDRALASVRVQVSATSSELAAAALRTAADRVRAAVPEPCSVRIVDYSPPVHGWDDEHRATADLIVDVPLIGLGEVADRMARLDACWSPVQAQLGTFETKDQPTVWVHARPPELVLDHPVAHLPAALARRADDERSLRAATIEPLVTTDRVCRPTGEITIRATTLAGIALVPTISCDVSEPDEGDDD